MIGVLCQGGMCNQMFQMAFGYVTSKKLNTPYFAYNPKSLKYFELEHNFEKNNRSVMMKYIFINLFRKSKLVSKRSDYKEVKWWFMDWGVAKNVCVWDNSLDSNNYLLTNLKDNTYYEGYFQSEEYYEKYADDIKKLFAIKPEYLSVFLETKQYMKTKKNIALHIRRKDYLQHGDNRIGGSDITLPMSYYRNCLGQIKDIEQYNIIFVSDDIEFVKQEFGNADNYYFENNDEITDFQILKEAEIVIIANSSFSWWAAWLNDNANKIVYAPEYFLGFKVKKYYPAGIKVKDWNWIKTE
jgi:Glycosyl transferase family 11